MIKICLTFFLCLTTSAINAVEFLTEKPDYMKTCEISKPEFVKCSTESIQQLFGRLKTGLPGLETLNSVDPFQLNKIKINQGSSNAVSIKVELSKIKISGLGNVIVKESQVSPKDYSWQTKLLLPTLRIAGDYALQGRILLIPLNGKGKLLINIVNMDLIMYTKTKLYTKGEMTFYNVTNVRVDYTISGLNANLTNLFNGNRELEDSTITFFNQNWQVLADALKPVIKQTVEEILLDTMKKLFDFLSAEYFISDIPTPEQLYSPKS